jgi:hypothetical protein
MKIEEDIEKNQTKKHEKGIDTIWMNDNFQKMFEKLQHYQHYLLKEFDMLPKNHENYWKEL